MKSNISVDFTRGLYKEVPVQRDGKPQIRSIKVGQETITLSCSASGFYLQGARGTKKIRVVPSQHGCNRPLIGMKGRYTIEVGNITKGAEGADALKRFLSAPQKESDSVIWNFLEMIVYQIAKNAEINTI